MTRWQMNKLGFVNFWLYDQEEIHFMDGHLLLRGENAAGKSITTQSFVPFILDGNGRPERLDPFGSKDRKMEFYLLGNEEREDSTGYLYMEYKKPEPEEYRTLIVGLHAHRGKAIEFWGACLCDGRRVGAEFPLCRMVGKTQLPFTKRELRDRLNSPANWAESPGEYRKIVNTRLFQFPIEADVDQYEQFIKLLIDVRKPKLNKDFQPETVKKILNDSLQPLTNMDLNPIVNSLENMDSIQAKLERLRGAAKSAGIVRTEYTRYNQYMLGRKGKAFLQQHSAVQADQRNVEKLTQEWQEHEEDLQNDKLEQQKQRDQHTALKEERAILSADTNLTEKVEQQASMRQELNNLHADCQRETTSAANKREQQGEKNRALEQSRRIMADDQSAWQKSQNELETNNAELLWQEHAEFVRRLQNPAAADFEWGRARLRELKKEIENGKTALLAQERAQEDYHRAEDALDGACTETRQKNDQVNAAENMLQNSRDELFEAYCSLETNSGEFRFAEEELAAIKRFVAQWQGEAESEKIREVATRRYQLLWNPLQKAKSEAETQIEAEQQTLNELGREKKELEARQELPPPRPKQVEATRALLQKEEVPCASFYELVDFAPGITATQKDQMEQQLWDMGILDALVLADAKMPAAQKILAENPDHFLHTDALQGQAEKPFAALVVDTEEPVLRTRVQMFLNQLCDQPMGELYLLADGRYRQGKIVGSSRAEGTAKYIGVEARRENRARALAELEEKITACMAELARLEAEKKLLGARQTQLETEWKALPGTADLAQAMDFYRQCAEELVRAQKAETAAADAAHRAADALRTCKNAARQYCELLPYQRTTDGYEDALSAWEQYSETLQNGQNNWRDAQAAAIHYGMALDAYNSLAEQIEESELRVRDLESKIRSKQAAYDQVSAYLNRPDVKEHTARLAWVVQAIKGLEDTLPRLGNNISAAEAYQVGRQMKLDEKKAILEEQKLRELVLQGCFREELMLGFVLPAGEATLSAAREAEGKIQPKDVQRDANEVYEALSSNLNRNSSALLEYKPQLKECFEPREDCLKRRHCVLLTWKGKVMQLPDFLTALQQEIETTENVLEENDRELFENILTNTLIVKLRARIADSKEWVKSMTDIMQKADTSMGLRLTLDWHAKPAEDESMLGTRDLVELLNMDVSLIQKADSQKIIEHFRARVANEKEHAKQENQAINYVDLMRKILDFREWFEFRLFYQKANDVNKRPLTNSVFNRFSGGEKAMAMYLPLFAAVSAQYRRAQPDSPRMVALDEAFAGVDDKNLEAMFVLLQELDMGYIMNSQALWGCYGQVKNLSIAELLRPNNSDTVTVLHYGWNGSVRRLREEMMETK